MAVIFLGVNVESISCPPKASDFRKDNGPQYIIMLWNDAISKRICKGGPLTTKNIQALCNNVQ